MIFLTVGTQLPFDRLVRAVAEWHVAHPDAEVFAQIGESDLETPFSSVRSLPMDDHAAKLDACSVVVSHVGMGTILTCVRRGIPLVTMPRRAALGEHRSDHQAATAERLREKIDLSVVEDAAALAQALDGPREALVPVLRAGERQGALSGYLDTVAHGLARRAG